MKLELFLLFILLLIFPFGQLTKLPLNIPEVSIYFHDLIIFFLFVVWLIKKTFRKEKILWPKLTKYILAFAFWAGFSLILDIPNLTTKEAVVSSLYLIRWLSYLGIYFVLSDLLKNNNKLKNQIKEMLIIVSAAAALLGLLQYIFVPDIRPLTAFGWDPHYYRVVGTYLDPGYTGMIFVLGIILILEKILSMKISNYFFILIFFIIYLALSLTYARSAYLAYLIVITLFSWRKKSIKFFIIALSLSVFTLFLLPRPGGEGVKLERKSTVYSRINNWRQSLRIAFDHPVFGTGFNSYRYTQRKYGFLNQDNWRKSHAGSGADSSLLFIFATTGIVGLISYFLLIIKIISLSYKKSWVIFLSLIALLSHSFFNNSLFYPWTMIWMAILLGFLILNT